MEERGQAGQLLQPAATPRGGREEWRPPVGFSWLLRRAVGRDRHPGTTGRRERMAAVIRPLLTRTPLATSLPSGGGAEADDALAASGLPSVVDAAWRLGWVGRGSSWERVALDRWVGEPGRPAAPQPTETWFGPLKGKLLTPYKGDF